MTTDQNTIIDDINFSTPMMKQYMEIKKLYPDCLLFFRLGDFYELFMEDAEIGSKILDITLTARHKGQDGKIPMCGVPFHAVDSYLNKIIKAGYKAAICEQTTKPEKGKNVVEREVIRIVTPGTVVDENILENKSSNFLLTLNFDNKNVHLSYTDISTGHLYYEKHTVKSDIFMEIASHVKRIAPKEVILNPDLYSEYKLLKILKDTGNANIFAHYHKDKDLEENLKALKIFFKAPSLSIFNVDEKDEYSIKTIQFLVSYLLYTQKDKVGHINKIEVIDQSDFMKIDSESIRNLEIFNSSKYSYMSDAKKSFIDVIDSTATSMGARKLRMWVLNPLINIQKIKERLESVDSLIKDRILAPLLENDLKKILDLERTFSKLGTGTANARDLIGLKDSIKKSIQILEGIKKNPTLANYVKNNFDELSLENLSELISKVESSITDEPPATVREGRMIKPGIDSVLDDIKNNISDSVEWINKLEAIERDRTGINNLKVGFNSVFGYYIEISKANTKNVPDNYVRKQTLVNAERYITEELKYKEEIVLHAEEKINELEFEIFTNIVSEIVKFSKDVQIIANIIGEIDVLNSFAKNAVSNNYVKPVITKSESFSIDLKEARHPVVEKFLEKGSFTPNDTLLNKEKYVHLITGPNMAGKSTYIRQVALVQILAQIGSFVPSEKAEISIVDGIYTRIGSGDALAEGYSTFMVEMIETAKILHNATSNSLIILDEVGRGTSTIDGLSIARAIVEYIHDNIKAKTLFATHFHELISLDQRLKHLDNYHVSISETDGDIHFLHKVENGGTDKSYGVEVAKLAGIPDEVVKRAKELLEKELSDQLKLSL